MGTTNLDSLELGGNLTVAGTANITGAISFTGNNVLGDAVTDTQALNGATTITTTSASGLTVGRQGATAPVLKVNAATASVATGVEVIGAASGSGVEVNAIGGTNENLKLSSKGTGTVIVATGAGVRQVARFLDVTGTVNEFTFSPSATGSAPQLAATGTDSNIGLILSGKGTGPVRLGQATTTDVRLEADQPLADSSGNEYLKFSKTASAVNELTVANAATTGTVALSVTGSDTAVANLSISSKAGGAAGVAGGTFTTAAGAGNTTGAGGVYTASGGAGGNDAVGGAGIYKGGSAGGGNRAGGNSTLLGGAGSGTGPGGNALVTGGDGGGGGNAGSPIIASGTPGGPGIVGSIFNRSGSGLYFHKMAAPTAKTTNATLTAAEIIGGWITVNQGGAGTSTQTTPTGTQIVAALPSDLAAGDCFDFYVINISTNAAEDAILAAGTDVSIVGDARVASIDAAGEKTSSGVFRFRYSGANVWVAYRVA